MILLFEEKQTILLEINIDNNSEPIQFSIEELPPIPKISQKLSEARDLENNYSTKEKDSSPENRRLSTSVKWLDDENSSKIDELRKEFQDFQTKITSMFERFLNKDGEPMYIGNVYSFSDKII